jgi:hypothetical protein
MRRFPTVLTTSGAFQHSRPSLDTVPFTVLLEIPTLLRCSLHFRPVLGAPPAIFTDYVTSLPVWEQDVLVLMQRMLLLVVSDGGVINEYGSSAG